MYVWVQGHPLPQDTLLLVAARLYTEAGWSWSLPFVSGPALDRQGLAAHFGNEGLLNEPSGFLGLVAEVAALRRGGWPTRDSDISRIYAHGLALAMRCAVDLELLGLGAEVVADATRVLLRIGALPWARELLEELQAAIDGHDQQSPRARQLVGAARLVHALVTLDSMIRDRQLQRLTSRRARLQAARELLHHAESVVVPCELALTAELLQVDGGAGFAAVNALEVRNRILTLDLAIAREEIAHGRDARLNAERADGLAANCIELADGWRGVGRAENSRRALVAGLDHVFRLAACGAQGFENALRTLTRQFSVAIDEADTQDGHGESERMHRTTLAHALALVGSPVEAERQLRLALASLHGQRASASSLEREGLLGGADDLIGTAMAIDRVATASDRPGLLYAHAHLVIRGLPPAQLSAAGVTVVRPVITRRHAVLGVSTAAQVEHWIELPASLSLLETLDGVRARAGLDLKLGAGKIPPPSSDQVWRDLMKRLRGQLRVARALRTGRSKGATRTAIDRVALVLESTALQVPWLGALVDARIPVRSVLAVRPGAWRHPAPRPSAADRQVVVNVFQKNEPLGRTLAGLAKQLGLDHVWCSTVEELRAALNTEPARVIVIGCHGTQQGVLGAASLTVGGTEVSVEEALGGVRLPVAASVVSFTCFGGGGLIRAGGEWDSPTEALIAAGARVVVTNRWPAWMMNDSYYELSTLLEALGTAAAGDDSWQLGEAVTRFVERLRGARPREPWLWAGWMGWTSLEQIALAPGPASA